MHCLLMLSIIIWEYPWRTVGMCDDKLFRPKWGAWLLTRSTAFPIISTSASRDFSLPFNPLTFFRTSCTTQESPQMVWRDVCLKWASLISRMMRWPSASSSSSLRMFRARTASPTSTAWTWPVTRCAPWSRSGRWWSHFSPVVPDSWWCHLCQCVCWDLATGLHYVWSWCEHSGLYTVYLRCSVNIGTQHIRRKRKTYEKCLPWPV